METNEVLGLVKAVHELEVAELQDRLEREQAFALTPTRALALARDPAAMTEDERRLCAGNVHARRLLDSCRRHLGLPPLAFPPLPAVPPPATPFRPEPAVPRATPWPGPNALQGTARTRPGLPAAAWPPVAAGGMFDTQTRPLYQRQFVDEQHQVTFTFFESPTGEFGVLVESPRLELSGQRLVLSLPLRAGGVREVEVDLGACQGLCLGDKLFGRFPELVEQLHPVWEQQPWTIGSKPPQGPGPEGPPAGGAFATPPRVPG